MEARFCTVTRSSGELFREILKYEGWKPNFARRYCVTCCILVIILIAAIQTLMAAAGGVVSGQSGVFFIFSACMAVLAFIVEWRTLNQRMERVIGIRSAKRMRQAGKRQGDKEEIYWYDDHCEIVEEDITSRYSYTGIRKIKEEEKYIFFTFGGKVTVAIDKDEFRKGKPEKFIKFIEDARVDK